MDKQSALEHIAHQISRCRICKKGKSGKPVPGEGNPDAKIVFLGEAPGKKEAKTGRPFVGRSGQLLRSMIRSVGLKEKDVYITSPVKYLPDSGTPTAGDINHGKTHLMKQLTVIQPKIIVLLGNVAARAMLGKSPSVLKNHGTVMTHDQWTYFLTLHPAAVIRFVKNKPLIVKDFEKLRSLL